MKKIMMIAALTFSINIIPMLGLNITENGLEIRDTFRMYVTSPLKV